MGGHLKRGENNLFKCKIRPIGKTNNQTKKKIKNQNQTKPNKQTEHKKNPKQNKET